MTREGAFWDREGAVDKKEGPLGMEWGESSGNVGKKQRSYEPQAISRQTRGDRLQPQENECRSKVGS